MLAEVSGMNCAMPCAPAELTTPASKPLSWNNSRMKKGTGTSFDCAAVVSVSQISSRERSTTGFGTGGSGGVSGRAFGNGSPDGISIVPR